MNKIEGGPAVIMAGVVGLALGTAVGGYVALNARKPNSVYVRDLNDDNRPDIAIKTNRGDLFIYLQQEDGTYAPLDKYGETSEKEIRERARILFEKNDVLN